MDGRNSCGRRISLLNDNDEPPVHHLHQHSHHYRQPQQHHIRLPSLSSRSPSYDSSGSCSPIGSPPTPPLVRSDSSDSTNMQTPSPVTPEFSFDGLPQGMASPVFSQAQMYPPHKDLSSAYPPITPNSGPLPYHPAPGTQGAYFVAPHGTENRAGAAVSASANPRSRKNSYPCPLAKQFNCNDYFTTSGHAARHAKKHTGKKDAYCPECNKAFTRKDNMEQHRRTHQSGRNATKTADGQAKKSKAATKRPKAVPLQSDSPTESSLSVVDPLLPLSPHTIAPPVQPMDPYGAEYSQRSPYPEPTNFGFYPTNSSFGLDALAIAASGEKRKYEMA